MVAALHATRAAVEEGNVPGGGVALLRASLELDKVKTIEYYSELTKKYPIKSIEDPFGEDDWESWKKLTKNTNIQVVGDDLFATNIKFWRLINRWFEYIYFFIFLNKFFFR